MEKKAKAYETTNEYERAMSNKKPRSQERSLGKEEGRVNRDDPA